MATIGCRVNHILQDVATVEAICVSLPLVLNIDQYIIVQSHDYHMTSKCNLVTFT